jgi:transglutaminase-like putative cysteine protease
MLHDAREHLWDSEGLKINLNIRNNILVAGIVIPLGLVLFSLITPSISIEKITSFFKPSASTNDPKVARSLGLVSQAEVVEVDILDASREGGLPNEHLIGSGSELSDQVVMVVRIESPQEEAITETPSSPIYLRALVYDQYTGRGWKSRPAEIKTHLPGEKIQFGLPEKSRLIRQQVQFVEDLGGFVYTVGTLVSVDHDFKVAWWIQDQIHSIYDFFGVEIEENSYRADSVLQSPSIDELKTAEQTYPEWIRNYYMSLPATVPDDVLALAVELTATETTPFDRAVAIERYLRQIPYTLDVTRPPSSVDLTEYFLFDLRKGYCDYYATAMVVLARAAGLPARYVTGYIGEHYDAERDAYIITADQAHAWVEVYFPEYGWVPFEPTGGRSAFERPSEPIPELPQDFEFDFDPLVPPIHVAVERWLAGILLGILVLIVLIWLIWKISDWRLSFLTVSDLLPKLYKRIYRYARWAEFPVEQRDTIYQFTDQFDGYINRFAKGSRWSNWLLEASGMLQEISDSFVKLLFTPQTEVETGKVLQTFKQLRLRLLFLWLYVKASRYLFPQPRFGDASRTLSS